MYEYKATVNRWIDGDTLLLDIDLGFFVTRQERIRLARINAAELNDGRVTYVRKAKHARAVGKNFCPHGSEVLVQTKKSDRDMYARYIAEVRFEGKNLSDYLLSTGAVKPFDELVGKPVAVEKPIVIGV
jgi:micrococcal nuclease